MTDDRSMIPADVQGLFARKLGIGTSFASSQTAVTSVLAGGVPFRTRSVIQDALQGSKPLLLSQHRNWSATAVSAPATSRGQQVGLLEQPATAQVIETSLTTEAQQSYLSVCDVFASAKYHLVLPCSHGLASDASMLDCSMLCQSLLVALCQM